MIRVHVFDRAFFGSDQFLRTREIRQHIGGSQIGSAREAAIEMRGGDLHPPE